MITAQKVLPAINESGIRRRTRTFWAWLWRRTKPFIVATRKKADGSEKLDGQEMLHRLMLGAIAFMVMTLCPWTRPLFGLPPAEKDTQTLESIKSDISTVKSDVKTLTVRVDNIERRVIEGALEGFWKGRR